MKFPIRTFSTLSLTLSLVMISSPALAMAADPLSRPTSIAVMGDSISRGANACSNIGDCADYNWSTGQAPNINSHATRLGVLNNSKPAAFNVARSGATISELPGQATKAITAKAQYITILAGNNDSCEDSEATMTSIDEFSAQVTETLSMLNKGLPQTKILVVGQPNPAHVRNAGMNNDRAVAVWRAAGICQTMLANTRSNATVDVERRARVEARAKAYNDAWKQVCAQYRNCRYTNVVYEYDFTVDDLSSIDYFHPSQKGQAKLAALTWEDPNSWPVATPTTTPKPTVKPTPVPQPTGSDLNNDGTVNALDLSILLSGWGSATKGDVNGDGTTNAFDLSLLLTDWDS